MRESSHLLAKVQRITGMGKGRPTEVAILEPEVRNVLREQSPVGVDHRDLRVGLGRSVQAAAQVRRHAPSHLGSICLFNLAIIPLFIGSFAVYGLYRGVTRRISMSVFTDLRNIMHALMISGLWTPVQFSSAHRSKTVARWSEATWWFAPRPQAWWQPRASRLRPSGP